MRYRYAGVIAINPNTDRAEVVKSATGTVHINEDWETPVVVQDVNGFDMTTLNTTVEGLFPDFYVEDQAVVGFKTSSGHRFYLRSSTPVPGPVGPPPVTVTAAEGALVFEYPDGTKVGGPPMPVPEALSDAQISGLLDDDTSAAGGAVVKRVSDIIGVRLPAPTGGDDTAAVNAVLAAAAGMNVFARRGATYNLTGALVIHSGTTLDASGATFYAESNMHPMLVNANANLDPADPTTGSGANRDRDIIVRGGLWQTGAVDGPNHRIIFNQVDSVQVEDAEFITIDGKYCVLFSDVTDYAARRLTFNSASDGVHITGPAHRGHVSDLMGTTGDDSVGITGVDYDTYNYSRGSIEELVIERVNTTTHARAVLIAPIATTNVTGTYSVRNVSLRDINAAAVQGIKADCNTSTANATGIVDNITIDGVSNTAVGGLGLVSLVGNRAGSYIGKVTARGLTVPRVTPNSAGTTRRYGVYITGTDVRDVTVEMRIEDVGTRQTRGVHIQEAAVVDRLVVSATSNFDIVDSGVVNIEGTAAVKALDVRGVFRGGRIVRTAATGQVQRAVLSGTHTAGSYAIYHTSPTAMRAHFENFVSVSAGDVTVILAGTGEASIDITGQMVTDRSSGPITGASATKKIRVYSDGVRADATKVTPVVGGELYNTNVGLPTGPGVCISDGTSWKNIYTGAVYTPA